MATTTIKKVVALAQALLATKDAGLLAGGGGQVRTCIHEVLDLLEARGRHDANVLALVRKVRTAIPREHG